MVYNRKGPHLIAVVSVAVTAVVIGAVIIRVAPEEPKQIFNRLINVTQGLRYHPYEYIFEGDAVTITNNEGAVLYSISYDDQSGWLVVRDGEGQEVVLQEENIHAADDGSTHNWYAIPGFGSVNIIRWSTFFELNRMYITRYENRLALIGNNGQPIDMREPVKSFGFDGREEWGSSRGYIWSRSFPVMLRYPLLGSGPDSFVHVFPQHDIVEKYRYFNDPYMIVDKAHNLYIQTWITTGGLSALALIFLIGYYLVTTFKVIIFSSNISRFTFGLRLGLLAAVSAFAVASMATDSTIGSTGVFYVLLGLGYAVNKWQA
jgi:hypothetical protein